MIIKPTVGRIVHYYAFPANQPDIANYDHRQPMAAIICYVWHDYMVNLSVMDQNGVPFSKTSVYLRQPGELCPDSQAFAEWMPFQIEQSARHIPSAEVSIAPAAGVPVLFPR